MSTENLDPDRLAQQARDISETLAAAGVNACPITEGVRRVCTELREGHVRLDETRVAPTKGRPIRARIDEIVTLLSWENSDRWNQLEAVKAERDAARLHLKALEHHRAAAEYRAATAQFTGSVNFTRIAAQQPAPHARYIVRRGRYLFTATPCYGMHVPWWVVTTLDGEAPPVPMEDADEWQPVPEEPQ